MHAPVYPWDTASSLPGMLGMRAQAMGPACTDTRHLLVVAVLGSARWPVGAGGAGDGGAAGGGHRARDAAADSRVHAHEAGRAGPLPAPGAPLRPHLLRHQVRTHPPGSPSTQCMHPAPRGDAPALRARGAWLAALCNLFQRADGVEQHSCAACMAHCRRCPDVITGGQYDWRPEGDRRPHK